MHSVAVSYGVIICLLFIATFLLAINQNGWATFICFLAVMLSFTTLSFRDQCAAPTPMVEVQPLAAAAVADTQVPTSALVRPSLDLSGLPSVAMLNPNKDMSASEMYRKIRNEGLYGVRGNLQCANMTYGMQPNQGFVESMEVREDIKRFIAQSNPRHRKYVRARQ